MTTLTALLACALLASSAAPVRVAVGAAASALDASVCDPKPKAANLNFTLKDVNGSSVKLADFKGKVVVLNFWATWCVPCRAEIPTLIDLQTKYAAGGLLVVGVSVDDPVEKMKPFVTQYKMNYPALTAFKNDGILDAYGPMVVVPWTTIIRRDGSICAKHVGPVTKEKFESEIKGLL
jgi:thiol-disulfide isomerase/thioredoxin